MSARRQRVIMVLGLTLVAVLWSAAPAWAQPANDSFAGATPVTLPPTTTEDTSTATAAAEDPTDCFNAGATVWFSFTPTTSQAVQVDTLGSSYDTMLQVVTGTPGAFTTIACNDDAGGGVQSAVEFDAQQGHTYYVMAGSCCDPSAAGGSLTLNVSQAPPPLTITQATVGRHGSVSSRAGVATIKGSYSCSATDGSIELFGTLTQKKGHLIASRTFDLSLPCETASTPWSAQVPPSASVAFSGGQATANVDFSACGLFTCDSRNVTQTVRLSGHKS